jgi:DNA-binding MarR family transcriptional regulator
MGSNTNIRRGTGGRDARRAMNALRRLVHALRASSTAVRRDTGVSGAQLFVLQQLAQRPVTSLNELAARTRTHQSSVSVVVSRLAERRLVARRPSAEDARRTEIELTEEGAALLDDAPHTLQTSLVGALGRLPTAQRSALADGLEAWVEAAGLASGDAPFFFEPDAPRRRA